MGNAARTALPHPHHPDCPPTPSSLQVEYSGEQLDLLAILFTVMKVAFVGGAVDLVAQMVHLVESARLESAVELHNTSIRNEAAYFGCVSRVRGNSLIGVETNEAAAGCFAVGGILVESSLI